MQRPVGTKGACYGPAPLPTDRTADGGRPRTPEKPSKAPRKATGPLQDTQTRKMELAYEREEKKREAKRRRDEAQQAKKRAKRNAAVAKAAGALEEAERMHEETMRTIEAERETIEARVRRENERWAKQHEELRSALQRAKVQSGGEL